jgi:hypothetical protein
MTQSEPSAYPVEYDPCGGADALARALVDTYATLPPHRSRHAVWVAGMGMLPRLGAIMAVGSQGNPLSGVAWVDMLVDPPRVTVLNCPVVFTADRCGPDDMSLWDRLPPWAVAVSEPASAGRAAAEWWGRQVYDRRPGRDTGDMTTTMWAAYADHVDPPAPAPAHTRAMFEDAVAAFVDGQLTKGRGYVFLRSDYGPRGDFDQLAMATGAPVDRFPFKTSTWAFADHVTVRRGHQAPERLIWHAPGWVRPWCETGDYDEGGERVGGCVLPKYHDEPHKFHPYPSRSPAEAEEPTS